MKYRHSHPVNIFEHTSRFLILLFFPLVRALLTIFLSGGSLYAWLRGAWFDICTVLLIIGLGFIGWFQYVYSLEDEGIGIKKGIFLVKYRFIPFRKLSVLSIERPYYLLPFGAVRVRADTDGGIPNLPDFAITIRKRELPLLVELANAPFVREAEMKRVYLPKNFTIAILSFVASNTLTGVLFVSTFISGAGKVLGDQFESLMMQQLSELFRVLAFGIPPAAAGVAFIILGGWLVSFVMNLVRHLGFSVTRQAGSLHIRSGVVTRREYWLTVRRINLIELHQTLLTKLFGFYSAFIHCNGYGKEKDELSVLMPSAERSELTQNLTLLLPEIPLCKPKIRPRLRYITRFLIPPLAWIGVVSALWLAAFELFHGVGDVILYIGLMAEIPCVWYLLVKIVSYFHTGIGIDGDVYTLSYTYGYRIKTIAVPKKRIVKLQIRRSLFQVMAGCCDVVAYTFSEGRKRHVIPNLPYREAREMMEAMRFYHGPEKPPPRPLWEILFQRKKPK